MLFGKAVIEIKSKLSVIGIGKLINSLEQKLRKGVGASLEN